MEIIKTPTRMKNVFALYSPFELNKNIFIFLILKIAERVMEAIPKEIKIIPVN